MISKKDFIRCMKRIQKNQKNLEKFMDDIGKYFDDVYIFSLGDQLLYTQIEILKVAVEDDFDDNWIDWYIFENEWGNNRWEAGYDDKTTPIVDFDGLYNLILERKNR